jgi:polysaccharide export outer membrane protein
VDVDAAVVQRLQARQKRGVFEGLADNAKQLSYGLGAGDVIEISIWEASPASLFGTAAPELRGANGASRTTALPEQMIAVDGTVNVPFAGSVKAAGLTVQQLEQEVVLRLKSKANQPQALVRLVRNNTAVVTVVGEVTASVRMPLTARGERVLDALAAAGGARQPVGKTTLQIARGTKVQAMPLEAVIRDPRQNILLQPGDVLTSLYQPYSFSVLGATAKNEEVNFEGQGISLVQALARAGGLQDTRAHARGVFVFRIEEAGTAAQQPVIYRLDLEDAGAFFAAQNFPIQDRDVLYVSNAPAADLQKFLNIVVQAIYPVANIVNMTK